MLLFGTGAQLAPEAVETAGATASEEGEQLSSDAAGDSEPDEWLDTDVPDSVAPLAKSLEGMQQYLGALDATLCKFVERLSALEKVVNAVQEDTLWVRGDVQVVHEVVEKLSDYVSVHSHTVATVEGVPEKNAKPVSAWGGWPAGAEAKEPDSAHSPGIGEDDELDAGPEELSLKHMLHDGDTAIQETQMYENDPSMQSYTMSLQEETEDGGWDKTLYSGRTLSLPTDSQQFEDDEDERLLVASTQVEMAIDGTQSGTLPPGRSIFASLVSTVRDMDGPLVTCENTTEGWVQSKRGRASESEVQAQSHGQSMVPITTGKHTILNLNLSPEEADVSRTVRGRGKISGTGGRGAGSRGGGRGGGRGAGRGKKPPLVQPRYGTKVSSTCALH